MAKTPLAQTSSKSRHNAADVENMLAEFSSKYLSEAVAKLNLGKEADIEMLLPTTNTQSQLAMSFAMDRRNGIRHSILKLKPGVSTEALSQAVAEVVGDIAVYRSAIFPCDDPVSPFAQVILTPEAWQRYSSSASRIVQMKESPTRAATDTKVWLELAEDFISLDSNRLYHIQVIQPESDSTPGLLIVSTAQCISDDTSINTLIKDISRCYAGLKRLPRCGVYDTVSDWASNVSPETDALWQKSLEGWEAESFGSLSGNNPHLIHFASTAENESAVVQCVSDIPWDDLATKSRAFGASPQSVLQASWAILLNLFSEADTGDVTFASVLYGSCAPAHAPSFSIVPCRVALPKTQTVDQLLTSLENQAEFAQSHQHTTFGAFKALAFSTALALREYSPEDANDCAEDLALWTEIQGPAVRHDFAILVEVQKHQLMGSGMQGKNVAFKLTYREQALSKVSAKCIAKQLASLTEILLCALPDDLAQQLPAQLPKELLSAEGTIPVPEDKGREDLLHHQFEEQAASTPDRLALSFYSSLNSQPTNVSYGELNARANGLARVLKQENVGIIPICMDRSVELYVGILAILKAGSAWCPIDETAPVQRRTSLIARTQSNILLTNTQSLHLVEPCLCQKSLESLRIILIDEYANHKSTVNPDPREGTISSYELSGQDLAYLLWTSGTTGEPKGVMIQHFAASQAMRDLQIQVEHDEKCEQVRVLQHCSYSFDVFVQDLFYTWGLAGSVISGTRELVLGTFVEFIWASHPTHVHLTPSFGASVPVDEIRGSTLQYVTFIGEKLTEDVAEAWTAPGITTRAYNTYGPAENAVVSTMRRFYGKSRDSAKAANVGFPLRHCTAYVVRQVDTKQGDSRCELVPRYGVGELALGGRQVGKGYLSNEEKTTKAFIQGGQGIDERIYRTGDMVRLNDHGFEFLGRNDDLVKITGIRIELSEISAACAAVKDEGAPVEHLETLYLPRPGTEAENNNKVIVTFASVRNDTADVEKLRAQIFQKAKDTLPAYMIPGHVVVLQTTMPKTASNKVDRKALQEIYKISDLTMLAGKEVSDQTNCKSNQEKALWTSEQLSVLQIIGEDFNVEIDLVSPGDTLAGLGFSSLQVTKLAWSLRRKLKCEIGVLDLMQCQYLYELADVVHGKLSTLEKADLPNGTDASKLSTAKSWVASIKDNLTRNLSGDMRPPDTLYVLPATPMQESLIFETMVEPGAYWVHRVFDMSQLAEVDATRLRQAWIDAARKFDIMRTSFAPLTMLDLYGSGQGNIVSWARKHGTRSSIMQLVQDKPPIRWISLRDEECKSLSSWATALQAELAPAKSTRPPWAVTYSEEDSKLMLSMHHALYDATSSAILLDTVEKLYLQESDDSHVVQFSEGMELGLLPNTEQMNEAASSWSERLLDLRTSTGALNAPFPDLTQSRQKQPQRILMSKAALPPSFLTHRAGVPSLPTLFQSAFGCILASYLELKAVVIVQTVSQRLLHPNLARVMGPAIATLPVIVRADAHSAETLWSGMASDSSILSPSMHHLRPADIKKMLNMGSGGSQASFPGLFVYHPSTEDVDTRSSSNLRKFFRELDHALSLNVEHPLALNIFEEGWAMELTGDGRRISQAQLDLMMEQIIEQARVMVEFPQIPLNQLPNKMRRSGISISGEASIGTDAVAEPTYSVSQFATKDPERIAVEELVFQDTDDGEDGLVTRTITYGQLDQLTNAIANELARSTVGLKPNDVVALYMGRDIKSLAATLAIFRAGYVYLPVDEELPAARKRLLIKDANARLVISTDLLSRDLDLNLDIDPPTFLLPDGSDDIDILLSWPAPYRRQKSLDGGYLLYTSGSTGQPKGVRVSNSSLCHFISSFSARLIEASPATATLGGSGKYLNLTSRAFDPHITQMFVPWHLGYRVVIGKDRTAMLGNLQQIINQVKVTHFGSVPAVLSQLGLRPEDVPSIRVITTGGDKASNELLDVWSHMKDSTNQGQDDKAVLFNFYGPTEVTIGCLGHAVKPDSIARNLGLPLNGLEAILLSPGNDGEEVVTIRGQPGELCIAGPQVAKGYLSRPVETSKSFGSTRLLGNGEKRIYKTGDMMRMMHDGSLEFLGRTDQQAKIRGQRLELDEVVAFLKGTVADASELDFAVAVVTSGNDGANKHQQLFGFIARNAKKLLKAEIKGDAKIIWNQSEVLTDLLEKIESQCQADLPAFMVPTLLWVSKIPYLVSGKVDTKLLTKLASDYFDNQARRSGQSELPATSVRTLDAKESMVIAAIEEAVGSTVNATAASSLQRLGIDSLSAVHLVSLLSKRGFHNLRIADILAPSSTVESVVRLADRTFDGAVTPNQTALTAHVEEDGVSQQSQAISNDGLGKLPAGLDRSDIEAVLPCLPLQSVLIARSLLWLNDSDASQENKPTTNVPYVSQFHYRLSRGTDVLKWKKAAELVISTEAILRTCFIQREDDGRLLQLVLRSPRSPFDSKDQPIDIVARMNTQPPIRLQISDADASGETIVALRIHHALFDGASINILRTRIQNAYNDLESPVSATKSLDILGKITAHCNLSSAQLDATRTAWQKKLHGIKPCHVDANNNTQASPARSTFTLGYSATELKVRLQPQSQQQHASISMSTAFQLATALCLSHLTRQSSVVYGFVWSLRPLLNNIADGVDNYVGPCFNTLIETVTLHSATETLPEVAQRVYESHTSACQGTMPLIGMETIQRWAASEDKLFDSLLSINLIDGKAPESTVAEPGNMTALRTESRSDMALAIDVDLLSDGRIGVTLSSSGALNELQLNEVGHLFERIVYSTSKSDARVDHFVSVHPAPVSSITNGSYSPAASELQPTETDYGNQEALASVQRTICHLLHLNMSDLSKKPKTISLYQLGLDSIAVLPFVKKINKLERIKLTANAVIKARTIQGVTNLVQEAKLTNGSNASGSLKPATSETGVVYNDANCEDTYKSTLARLAEDILFVATPLQESMLSASLAIVGDAYTYTHAVQLSKLAMQSDSLTFDKFFAAVGQAVQSCEILRTKFIFTQDDTAPWVGVVSPTEQSDLVKWEVDSKQPGLIRLKIHHALYDAASIKAVWRIIGDNYHELLLQGATQSRRDAKVCPYRPFAKAVASAQTSSVAFWTNVLDGYNYLPLSFTEKSLYASSAYHFALDESQLSAMHMRCKDLGVTTKAVLQLSWAKVLCEELYGQSDVVCGDVVSTVGDLADDDDAVMVGPAINTIPVRIQLGKTPSMDVAEALALVQNNGDCARGENAMASLRRVQAAWKSSALDREHIPASLFQSLFVFDGIISAEESESNGAAEPLFKPARTRTAASEDDNAGPAYDDYPLIVSFHIKNNTLHGKLRAKMSAARVGELGGRLEAAVKDIISSNLQSPVLDKECMGRLRSRNEVVNGTSKQGSNDPKLNGHGDTASEAVLETVKAVLGSRYKDKVVSYDTRLANIGLDSILAIRLSMMLKKQLGMHISVFDLIKGASVQDIVNGASYSHTADLKPKQKLISAGADLKQLIAEKLALPPDLVKSVQPLMAGQRGHLEQWLHNGKRFYEAPWVYRIEESVDRQRVENCWAELCRAHEILRTTFVWTGDVSGSVQVTLSEDSIRAAGFTVLHEQSKSIEDLIEEHVRERNMTPSDFCKPPARLSLLEAQNGKAVVLRLHHALYDAWSIKMIERDFDTLLALGQVHEIGPSLEKVLQEIRRMRDPDAEDSYWKRHLSHAQDTVLRGPEDDASLGSPLGAHFKVKYSAVVPQSYLDGSSLSRSNTKASAAILLAYARTLQRFTKQSYPTFGLTHASRSLSTTDGMETLDLTSTSLPTLTVTPFCVDLSQQSSSSDNELLGYAQDHLAQLTKFAQADNIERVCPKFNSYVSIIHRQHDSTSVANGETAPRILARYRLEEPLASDYFTVSQPSPSTVSAIDGLKTSHLLPHRLFFNVNVHSGQDIKVVVSGDEALFGRDDTMVTKIVSFFGSELSKIARDSVEC